MDTTKSQFNPKYILTIISVVGVIISIATVIGNMDWDSTQLIYTYNPYVEVMEVYVDKKKPIYIQSQEKKVIGLKKGKHHIVAKVGKYVLVDTDFNVSKENKDKGAILNLTNAPMYLWGVPYIEDGYNTDEIDWTKVPINSALIGDELLYGDVKEYPANQIVIQKEWDFDVDQPISMKLQAHSLFINGLKIKYKLFTKSNLLDYWLEYEKPIYENQQMMDSITNTNEYNLNQLH